MKVQFTEGGWNDYLSWQADDRRLLKRVNQLIEDIRAFRGQGNLAHVSYALCVGRRKEPGEKPPVSRDRG